MKRWSSSVVSHKYLTFPQHKPGYFTKAAGRGPEDGAGVADHYVKPAGTSTPRHSERIGGHSRRVVRYAGYPLASA
jgi:hypothetical protein